MSDPEFSGFIKRLHQELTEIQRVLTRINEGWQRARQFHEDFYIDSVALNLHGFYSGFERIFIHIAEIVDDNLPRGENWHELLLKQSKVMRAFGGKGPVHEAMLELQDLLYQG